MRRPPDDERTPNQFAPKNPQRWVDRGEVEPGKPIGPARTMLDALGTNDYDQWELGALKVEIGPGDGLNPRYNKADVYVQSIELSAPKHGRDVLAGLRRITGLADEHNVTLHLHVSPFAADVAGVAKHTKEETAKIYERYGFVHDTQRGSTWGNMHRPPRTTKTLSDVQQLVEIAAFFDG